MENQPLGQRVAQVSRNRATSVPRVRPVMQLLLSRPTKSEDGRQLARNIVLEWAAEKWPGLVPASAWRGIDFEVDQPGLKLGALYLPQKGIWGFHVEHMDSDAQSRTWVMEVVVADLEEGDVVGVRNQCSSLSFDDVPASSPRFVRSWVERQSLMDDEIPVQARPRIVSSQNDIDWLLDALHSIHRELPVVALSQSEISAADFSIDANKLARNVAGLAHVICLSSEASYLLSRKIGKDRSVFNGAARTYLPGFGGKNDVQVHMNVLAGRIANWSGKDGQGPLGFVEFLSTQLHRFSVSHAKKRDQVPSFSGLRKTKADDALAVRIADIEARRRELDTQNVQSEEERRELLQLAVEIQDGEIERLNREIGETNGRLNDSDQLLEMADGELTAARNEMESLKAQNAHLLDAIKRLRNPKVLVASPDTYEALPAWVDENFADKLLLLPRAKRALKDAVFLDVGLVVKCVCLLAVEYWDLRTASPDLFENAKAKFERKMNELQVDERASISESRLGEVSDQYTVDYIVGQSSRQRLDRHLRGGSSTKDDRYCLRVYFFWDDAQQKVIVGHLPSHLDTRSS